jgi:large subunit ribosomal protein L10
MLTRAQKEEQVTELSDVFARARCVYVADYRGLGVESINKLRQRVHKEGGGDFEYRVTKNRLLKRAADSAGASSLNEHFTGPTAIAVSYGDPAGLAKILAEFAKDHESFELKGGLLEGAPISSGEIATLATLPSLDELRSQIVGLVLAPATKLARLLNEPGAQLARVVQAKSAQGEAG